MSNINSSLIALDDNDGTVLSFKSKKSDCNRDVHDSRKQSPGDHRNLDATNESKMKLPINSIEVVSCSCNGVGAIWSCFGTRRGERGGSGKR